MTKKHTTEFIRKEFKKEDYKLLSEYKNSNTPVEYRCPKKHLGKISYDSWRSGSRCRQCAGNNIKHTYEFIKSEFEKEEYILLTKEYKNIFQKLEYICPNNHKHSITYNDWRKGARCKFCHKDRLLNNHPTKHSYNFVKKSFEKENWKLLTEEDEYEDSHQLLDVICSENHNVKARFYHFKDGVRCHKCFSTNSNAENELFDIIKNKFPDAIQNDRKLISPLELDIVIPSKKIAIEYCGLYWHSEKAGKDRNYHLNKLNECNKKGYNLITIFEDEWLENKKIVLSRLFNILGMSEANKIYARKCEIKEINTKLKNDFLNEHHIQGSDRSRIKLGAFYNNKLVSVMTFSKPSIAKGGNSKDGVWELNRFCSHKDYQVIGIGSKLFTYYIGNYTYTEIFTYGDKRWSKGNLYKKLGFEYIHDSEPNYWYIVQNKRYHRFNFRKSILKNKLENFDENLTEIENMNNNGYYRIFDCGSTKFSYKNKKNIRRINNERKR